MKNKNVISILLLMFSLSICVAQKCPAEGDGRNDKEKMLNRQKNRDCVVFAGDSIEAVSIDSILKHGDDRKRFNVNQLVVVEGYLVVVKGGGSESCNCHTKDKAKLDIHLELGASATAKNTESFICEITPKYFYRDRVDFKSMLGKKVRVTGYMFYDLEHEQNAVNTSPAGKNLWRGTSWEVHPVINIDLVK